MNKYKKIATAVVATVMAGTMTLGIVGCKRNRPDDDENEGGAYDVTLNLNVGDSNARRAVGFHSDILAGSVTLPDGKQYGASSLKPAWQALSDELQIKFNNSFTALSSDAQITTAVSQNKLAEYDLLTGSGAQIINQPNGTWVDLNQHLDQMPNYKAFLESNPIVYLSLTSNTTTKAMYYAPYFDGNDDIEKYVLAKREWVRAILDATDVSAATTTFKEQVEAKKGSNSNLTMDATHASVQPFMGTTGSWKVDTTDPANDAATVKVVVNYTAANTAAKNAETPLGGAIAEAAGKGYSGNSGNIVDLMNFAINEKAGVVKGAQLIKILQAYIDVAYQTEAGAKFYAKRSDVFNSASAAWDVDLLAALYRCVVTSMNLFDDATKAKGIGELFALSGRQATTQRCTDLVAFVGELYGIRGLESRYEYTYIDSDNAIKDARQNTQTYDALAKMSAMAKEGLLYTGTNLTNGHASYAASDSIQTFMMHDYVQTQTQAGFNTETQGLNLTQDGVVSSGALEYDFAPILTPVSKWTIGSDEQIMRFTESWRAVKNTGFCVPAAAVAGNEKKLNAVLKLIDYLFSNDGQILMTYGAQSTNGNTNPNGWWYATKVTNVNIDTVAEKYAGSTQYHVKDEYASQYFIYKNEVYTGTSYNGRQIPTITDANRNFYYGKEVNGFTQGTGNAKVNRRFNYTDYAREYIGACLPIGNKDQGFEFQATSACGLDGAATVATALNNGTVQHLVQDTTGLSPWYRLVPTTFPFDTVAKGILGGPTMTTLTGTYFLNNSATTVSRINMFIGLAFHGYDTNVDLCYISNEGKMPANADAYIAKIGSLVNQRVSLTQAAWTGLLGLDII